MTMKRDRGWIKLLAKYLREAPKSFLYKMLRKKNITLNGKKASGSERLFKGDEIEMILAEETIAKFAGDAGLPAERHMKKESCHDVRLDILYEDSDILLINKPAGMLSQKAQDTDVSLVEYLHDYLLQSGSLTGDEHANIPPLRLQPA